MNVAVIKWYIILFILVLYSCATKNDITEGQPIPITNGTWRISHFMKNGKDDTGEFNDFKFVFATNGTITATRNNINKSGTWTINSSSKKFLIDLGGNENANKPLGELTDDWKIISINANEINLKDDNASRNEMLIFTKN